MANNLKDHLKEVADAIRAKKGTTDLINPQDFATEISAISGGSTIEYLDVRNATDMTLYGVPLKATVAYFAQLAKFDHPNGVGGIIIETPMETSSWAEQEEYFTFDFISVAIDFNAIWRASKTGTDSVLTQLAFAGISQEQLDAIPRITKEEFYSLD